MEGKCGFIDQTGKEVIPFIYDDARYFNKDGKAKVKLNGETFFIDDSTENCRVAETLGISTYTPKACEDWSHLFS
jgi:hypothetical protein